MASSPEEPSSSSDTINQREVMESGRDPWGLEWRLNQVIWASSSWEHPLDSPALHINKASHWGQQAPEKSELLRTFQFWFLGAVIMSWSGAQTLTFSYVFGHVTELLCLFSSPVSWVCWWLRAPRAKMMSVKHLQCARPSAKCVATVKAYRPPSSGGVVPVPALAFPGIHLFLAWL